MSRLRIPARRRTQFMLLAVSAAIGICGGAIYGLAIGGHGDGGGGGAPDALRGALTGLLISLICAGADIFVLSDPTMRRIRALPFPVFVGLRAGIYAAGIFAGLRLPVLLLEGVDALEGWSFSDALFRQSFVISLVISLLIALTMEISRLLGPGVLPALLTGRYHKPRREERVFLFADIEGSTALAERIGDLEFHRFMASVVADWSEPVGAARGETYRYVGDEIIVSWPLKRGLKRGRCVACVFGMQRALAARADWYRAEFGAAPHFRAALHCGPVVTGEMGDQRKEITFLGDTVNTAARLQGECRVRGEHLLLSGVVADRLPADAPIRLRALGEWTPRGKTRGIRVFAADDPDGLAPWGRGEGEGECA